jgi:hypothetical protein
MVPSGAIAMLLRSKREEALRSNSAALAAPPSPRDPATPVPASVAIRALAPGADGVALLPSVNIWLGADALVRSREADDPEAATASARAATFAAKTLTL